MKRLILSCAIALFIFTSCGYEWDLDNVPSCIKDEIKNASRGGAKEAKVTQYLYNGENVFAFDPGVVYPDIMYTIVNEDCEVVCQFGGFAGLNTCPNFLENAELIGVIWENN